jgi:hypothetical protein
MEEVSALPKPGEMTLCTRRAACRERRRKRDNERLQKILEEAREAKRVDAQVAKGKSREEVIALVEALSGYERVARKDAFFFEAGLEFPCEKDHCYEVRSERQFYGSMCDDHAIEFEEMVDELMQDFVFGG